MYILRSVAILAQGSVAQAILAQDAFTMASSQSSVDLCPPRTGRSLGVWGGRYDYILATTAPDGVETGPAPACSGVVWVVWSMVSGRQ